MSIKRLFPPNPSSICVNIQPKTLLTRAASLIYLKENPNISCLEKASILSPEAFLTHTRRNNIIYFQSFKWMKHLFLLFLFSVFVNENKKKRKKKCMELSQICSNKCDGDKVYKKKDSVCYQLGLSSFCLFVSNDFLCLFFLSRWNKK